MNVLMAVRTVNEYWQQIALALQEAGALGRYCAGYIDPPSHRMGRVLRQTIGRIPSFDRALRSRQLPDIDRNRVVSRGFWDVARSVVGRLGFPTAVEDWFFNQGEMRFDRSGALDLERDRFDSVLAAEYGALRMVQTARRLGVQSIISFVSPHHAFREKWVDRLCDKHPELLTSGKRRLMKLARERDARRDAEMHEADAILSCSPLISRTLEQAGVPATKIWTVPLGCPPVPSEWVMKLERSCQAPLRVMYAGLLAPHKGISYLLKAWQVLKPAGRAELHLYGQSLLPSQAFAGVSASVHIHGAVTRAALDDAYAQADVLVFPSLCDGFGAVVSEAFSRGVPAIVSENAGASTLIRRESNGWVVPPADSNALVERITWCLENRAKLLAMRRSAYETAGAWGWPDFRHALRRVWQPSLERAA